MSSLSFVGDSTSYLNIPNNSGLNFGTGDFTIEWYQYQTDNSPFPRIFQIGNYGTGTSIGVSIEGGSFIFWSNSSPNFAINLDTEQYKNKWVHFAICHSSSVTTIYMDGVNIFAIEDGTDYNSSDNLVIGNESTPSDDGAFGGYIYYFHFVKGTALYTTDFTVSTGYPTVIPDTVLLLTADGFYGSLGNTVENYNVVNFPNIPVPTPAPPVPNDPPRLRIPLFTNNAQVYYKKASLASCGVGSVRNSSVKSRRI
jgi:hypothetical protein